MPELKSSLSSIAQTVRLRSLYKVSAFVACGAFLVACAPKEPFADDGITRRGASLAGLATPVTAPAEFVRDARPAEPVKFIPVGVTPPKRELQPRAAAGVASLEAELDAQRNAARAFSTRPAPPPSYDGSKPPKVEPPPKELLPQ